MHIETLTTTKTHMVSHSIAGFFTCVNGFSELRLNNNLTGGWCICIRIWVVLNVVGRVDGIMMASGLIEIHKIS